MNILDQLEDVEVKDPVETFMTERKIKRQSDDSFITTPYTHLPFTPSEVPMNIMKTHDHPRDISMNNDSDDPGMGLISWMNTSMQAGAWSFYNTRMQHSSNKASKKHMKEKEEPQMTPIDKLCKVDEVVEELNELYEILKPSNYHTKTTAAA